MEGLKKSFKPGKGTPFPLSTLQTNEDWQKFETIIAEMMLFRCNDKDNIEEFMDKRGKSEEV